jgi:hypothetical protein
MLLAYQAVECRRISMIGFFCSLTTSTNSEEAALEGTYERGTGTGPQSQRQPSIQVHLRMPRPDAELLRALAEERDQSQSAVVRYLLRRHYADRHADIRRITTERPVTAR